MTGRGPEQDAAALAERWWSDSQRYLADPHWRKASATLEEADARILLLGPGPKSDLWMITLGLERFLKRAGFNVNRMDEELAPDSHRSKAREYDRIAAVPVTVGSSVEVFDLLIEDRRNGVDSSLRHRITVLLPENYASSYFGRVLGEDLEIRIRFCDPLGPEIDEVPPAIGRLLLKRLAEELNNSRAERKSRSLTEQAPEPSNLQAREAVQHPPELERPAPTINVGRDAYVDSSHASGESPVAGGRDPAGAGGTVASGESQIARADNESQAATGEAQASSGGAPAPRENGFPKLAVFFGLLLVASIVALIVGLKAAVVGVVVGAIGVAVTIFRLYRGI